MLLFCYSCDKNTGLSLLVQMNKKPVLDNVPRFLPYISHKVNLFEANMAFSHFHIYCAVISSFKIMTHII